MYVRPKIARGKTYYQIVEGVRTGDRVRQRIVLALGPTPDPRIALEQWRRELARLGRERRRWTRWDGMPKTMARLIDRLDAQIAGMASKVEMLAGLIKSRSIGTTPERKEG
jgi:hypothetical protein